MDNRPVGIFDSGVGGLTVVQAIIRDLPKENLIYFGDTARMPYGAKSPETLLAYGQEIIRFLIARQVKAVVIACGTISSNVYEPLCESFADLPLIDVINPGVEACLRAYTGSPVGFIATEATVRSGAFEKKIRARQPDMAFYTQACPLFVPLAEEGWTDNAVTRMTAEIYLEKLRDKGIGTLVLGCTHYPLLAKVISEAVGSAALINMAAETAAATKQLLQARDMAGDNAAPVYDFYVSGGVEKFNAIAWRVLGKDYQASQRILD